MRTIERARPTPSPLKSVLAIAAALAISACSGSGASVGHDSHSEASQFETSQSETSQGAIAKQTTTSNPTATAPSTTEAGAEPNEITNGEHLKDDEYVFAFAGTTGSWTRPLILSLQSHSMRAWTLGGYLQLDDPSSTDELYSGIYLASSEVLATTGDAGGTISRTPVTADITDWASNLSHSILVDQGTGTIGGFPARWWQIETATECANCFYSLLPINGYSWRVVDDSTHKIWVVDDDGSYLVIDTESPTPEFETWSKDVADPIIQNIVFGDRLEPVANDLAGPHTVGRLELTVVDDARQTNPVGDSDGPDYEIVLAADTRTLPVSLTYPATGSGYDTIPASGSFPLVVVAPSLGGLGLVDTLDRLLASHGFLVARIQFPESSFPGSEFRFVQSQPGDVSFVIDQLQGDALPEGLAAAIEDQPVGLIGYSLGGTTIYGLLGAECCLDPRIKVAVAHAGTFHHFNSETAWATTPILLVGSQSDEILANADLLSIVEEIGDTAELLNFALGQHLAWLDPQNDHYTESFEATLDFLTEHLKHAE